MTCTCTYETELQGQSHPRCVIFQQECRNCFIPTCVFHTAWVPKKSMLYIFWLLLLSGQGMFPNSTELLAEQNGVSHKARELHALLQPQLLASAEITSLHCRVRFATSASFSIAILNNAQTKVWQSETTSSLLGLTS